MEAEIYLWTLRQRYPNAMLAGEVCVVVLLLCVHVMVTIQQAVWKDDPMLRGIASLPVRLN
jgi:hypothetical protein